MELKEFVREALLDITNAVSEAQDSSLLYIAPGAIEGQKITAPQMVSFEVIVTASKKAGGGIRVLTFGEAKAEGASNRTNRISFEVPVFFQAPTERSKRRPTVGSGGGALGPNVAQAPVPPEEAGF